MKRFIPILLLSPILIFGQFAKVGINGAKFLDIPVSARAVGMGEAYTAVGDDASAVFFNPAGLALTKGLSVFLNNTYWWANIKLTTMSVTQNLGMAGNIGFFDPAISTDDMEATTIESPEGTGQFFTYGAYEAGVTFSRFMTDRFAFGINIKMIKENYPTDNVLNNHTASGFGVDVGGYYLTGFRSLRIGLAITNFGPDVTPAGHYDSWANGSIEEANKIFTNYPLPVTFRSGFAMEVFKTEGMDITAAFDLIHPSDNIERYTFGTEANILDILYIRGGYEINRDKDIFNYNSGIGIAQKFGIGKFRFDYSYSSGNILPGIHRVSLALGF